jgi:hypothetical protein
MGMRVGISVLTHEGQSIWENGLGQNVLFLARLLRGLPFVSRVVLLDAGSQGVLPGGSVEALGEAFELLRPREATHEVDTVIEMAGGLDVEWLDYVRALGKRVVFFCCGQPYVSLIEPAVFSRPGFFTRAERCDEVWILGKDAAYAPMLAALHRCPVHEVPYLWAPEFLEHRCREVAAHGLPTGYVPQAHDPDTPRALRAAIFEPNISVVKSCVIPLLVCEAAFRREPGALAAVHVLNSVQMQEHPTFRFMTQALDIVQQGRTVFGQRHDFAGYMAQHADLVVSHQWCNEQNYLYLDALHGGYPLVHNSGWLKAGYYYAGSQVQAGAARVIEAAYRHDANLGAYRREAQAFIATLSPRASGNAQRYAQRLVALAQGNRP